MQNSLAWTSRLMSGQVFVKFSTVPIWHKYRNERTGESLDVQIKGEPSERHATHHTAAAADPERREALISPTRWNTVQKQLRADDVYMCVCVCVRVSQAPALAAPAAATSLFWVCRWVPGRKAWLMGPSYGKERRVLKERREVNNNKKGSDLKQILIQTIIFCNKT